MNYWKTFRYVDAHYLPAAGRPGPWRRMQFEHVTSVITESERTNCFTTIQRFRDAVSIQEQEQKSDGSLRRGPSLPVIDNEEGIQAPVADTQVHYHGLYFDFDSVPKEGQSQQQALAVAQADAGRLVVWLKESFPDISDAHIQCWFTGSKGFHVVVRPEVFDIRPHHYLTDIVKKLAYELADELELGTMDRTVYSRRRMWRLPNTINPRTGLYKIELSVAEVLKLSIRDIADLAQRPRRESDDDGPLAESNYWQGDEYASIQHTRPAAFWWRDQLEQWQAVRDMQSVRPKKPILQRGEGRDHFPACIKDLMEHGPKPGGAKRNRVLLPIAGFFKDAGFDKEHTHLLVSNWTKTHFPTSVGERQRLVNGRSVVEQAYKGNLSFSCRYVRSCGGQGRDTKVACVGEANCEWIRDPDDQALKQTPFLHLSEAAQALYSGTPVRSAIHVAAMATRSFSVPMTGIITCVPDPDLSMCEDCANNWNGTKGKLEWSFERNDRDILALAGVNDAQKAAKIKEHFGIPHNCRKHKRSIVREEDVQEVQIIPMVDYANAYTLGSSEDEEDITALANKHTVEVAYFVGKEEDLKPNGKYLVEMMPHAHPKDQTLCFIFHQAEPAQNDIDQFVMTDELREKLKMFQPRTGQSVTEKMAEIHRDLLANVHRINGRSDLAVAVDLCYHSVIGFRLGDIDVKKGWFELVVVGDSGVGKTTLVEKIIEHYGLGELIAGEESRRTGLVYASIQVQGSWTLLWGKVPQNDRRLLVIDEFAGIDKDEIGKLTQLRSEGVARGSGVNQHHTTWARTRLILLTNPRSHSQSMKSRNYGVEAVSDLFAEQQDLRRVDLALTANKADVSNRLVMKRWDNVSHPHMYTQDLCRNLVLWAWSRNPRDVEWSKDAIDAVHHHREKLGEVYECDLTLAMREDLHVKIARISAAVAARMFSTDEKARKLYVKKEHVEFAAQLMDRSYRKKSMGYMQYANKWKKDNHFSPERQDAIKEHLRTYGKVNGQMIVSMLLDIDGYINKGALADMLSLDTEDFKRLWRFLMKERLLVRKSKGFRKTDSFAELLRNLGVESTGYTASDDEPETDFLVGIDFDEMTAPAARPNGQHPPASTHSGEQAHQVEFEAPPPSRERGDLEQDDSPFEDDDELDDAPF